MKGTELAEAAGVRAHTVWRWESGKFSPDADNLPLIAAALGVSVDWLLTGEGAGSSALPTLAVSKSA